MTRLLGPLAVLVIIILSLAFATMNATQRVTIDLGLFVLYGVPVTAVAFGGLFTGLLVMLVAGVNTDLKVRSILRRRLEEEDRDERARIDRDQRDLFKSVPDEEDE